MSKTEEVYGRHELSQVEKDAYKEEIGELLEERSRLEIKIKDLQGRVKDRKDDIKAVEAKLRRISDAIRTGEEERYIECTIKYKPKSEIKEYYDIDTGELITTKPMTEKDYQINLELEEEKKLTENIPADAVRQAD